MKRSTATMKDKDGKDHLYAGAAIQDILDLAGVTTGDQLRGKQLTKYVLAEKKPARSSFQVTELVIRYAK